MTFHISINDTQSQICREYHEGLSFDKPYEVALKSFVTYNNIFNVTEANNKFVWFYPPSPETVPPPSNNQEPNEILEIVTLDAPKSPDISQNRVLSTHLDPNSEEEDAITYQGTDNAKKRRSMKREHVKIPSDIYEIKDLARFIESRVPQGKTFKMELDKTTFTVAMLGTVGIDFSARTSVGPLLGFKRTRYVSNVRHTSNGRVDIFPINMIRVRCNLVKSNICDNRRYDDTIYEFPLSVLPGEKIIERPSTATFYKVNTDTVYELHLKVVDQDNHLVDFRGERLNIVLEFKPVSSI